MNERAKGTVGWTIKERDPRTGLYLPRLTRKNLFTDAGLTNLASLWAGGGSVPAYLILETFPCAVNSSVLAGVTSIDLTTRADAAGDTQLVLGVGSGNEEVVNWTGVGSGPPYTYSLSAPTTKPHTAGELCVRQHEQTDTLSTVKAEGQFDSVSFPGARLHSTGAGFSPGAAQWTMQFFITGSQAVFQWTMLGLSDTGVVGSGILQNHLVFGYLHPLLVDVELDITLTLANA